MESLSLFWCSSLQTISQLSEYIHHGPGFARPQTSEHVDLDEGDISSISGSTFSELISLQNVQPLAKVVIPLKSVDYITHQQNTMKPSKDTNLLPRKRKIRRVFEKRRRRLFSSAKLHKIHMASSRTTRFMRSLGLPMLPKDKSTKTLAECVVLFNILQVTTDDR
jgi:hypothetical protein